MWHLIYDCHFAKCHYAKWHYAEWHYAEWHYDECHFAKFHNAECHYAECHNGECRGAAYFATAISHALKMLMKLTPDEYPLPNVTKHFGTIISQCVVLCQTMLT
jgi:hypothetical protein